VFSHDVISKFRAAIFQFRSTFNVQRSEFDDAQRSATQLYLNECGKRTVSGCPVLKKQSGELPPAPVERQTLNAKR